MIASSLNTTSVLKAIAACSPSDFDGHTDFAKLTPSQRLDALASMARFVNEFKGKAQPDRQKRIEQP